jgi:hypothetical protein
MKTTSLMSCLATLAALALSPADARANGFMVGLDAGSPGGAINFHGFGMISGDAASEISGLPLNMFYFSADSGILYKALDVAGLGYVDPANVAPGVMHPEFIGIDMGVGVAGGPLALGVGAGFDLGGFYGPGPGGGSELFGAVDGQLEARLALTLPGVMIMAVPYWGGTAVRDLQLGKVGVDLRAYVAPEDLGGLGLYGKVGFVEHTRRDERTDEVVDQFSTVLFQVGVGFGGVGTDFD